jgi:hypothetical protein
MTDIEKPV